MAVNRWSIEFDQVEFHYQMRPTKGAQGMSFKVEAGNVAALVGRSGVESPPWCPAAPLLRPSRRPHLLGGADLREPISRRCTAHRCGSQEPAVQ